VDRFTVLELHKLITTLLTILAFGSDDFSGTARVYVANLTHTVHVILHRKNTGLVFPSQGNATCLKRRLHTLIRSTPDGIYYRYSISLCSCTCSKNCFIRNWINPKSQVTGKLTKVKLILKQAMKAQSRGRDAVLLFL